MVKLISNQEARRLDADAQKLWGIPSLSLMEEAALKLHLSLKEQLTDFPPDLSVVYLAGTGNNGGDALAMARHAFLEKKWRVSVFSLGPGKTEENRVQRTIGEKLGIPFFGPEDTAWVEKLSQARVWVDGLWGVGLTGPLRDQEAGLLDRLRLLQKELAVGVAAIDLPSGLDQKADVLECRWTLACGPAKQICYEPDKRHFCGIIIPHSLSFPEPDGASVQLLEESDLGHLLPEVNPDLYKNQRGHTYVFGGSENLSGAPLLACRSAQAAGTGLVSLFCDPPLAQALVGHHPSLMVHSWAGESLDLSRADSLVIGPGWGREGRDPFLDVLIRDAAKAKIPLVIDADGLGILPRLRPETRDPSHPFILTPHPGELRMLTGKPATLETAVQVSRQWHAVVVLKGSVTWIFSPDGRTAVWDGRCPALACAGSGDCLAGFAGAFLGWGMDPFQAAVTAVVLHGTAGRSLALSDGWFNAEDLPPRAAWMTRQYRDLKTTCLTDNRSV